MTEEKRSRGEEPLSHLEEGAFSFPGVEGSLALFGPARQAQTAHERGEGLSGPRREGKKKVELELLEFKGEAKWNDKLYVCWMPRNSVFRTRKRKGEENAVSRWRIIMW